MCPIVLFLQRNILFMVTWTGWLSGQWWHQLNMKLEIMSKTPCHDTEGDRKWQRHRVKNQQCGIIIYHVMCTRSFSLGFQNTAVIWMIAAILHVGKLEVTPCPLQGPHLKRVAHQTLGHVWSCVILHSFLPSYKTTVMTVTTSVCVSFCHVFILTSSEVMCKWQN